MPHNTLLCLLRVTVENMPMCLCLCLYFGLLRSLMVNICSRIHFCSTRPELFGAGRHRRSAFASKHLQSMAHTFHILGQNNEDICYSLSFFRLIYILYRLLLVLLLVLFCYIIIIIIIIIIWYVYMRVCIYSSCFGKKFIEKFNLCAFIFFFQISFNVHYFSILPCFFRNWKKTWGWKT